MTTNQEGNTLWADRIQSANRYYKDWSDKFKCDVLERYYEGDQWKGKKDYQNLNYNPYILNLFYSTIKIKLAGLIFQKPQYMLSPRPGMSDWDLDMAVKSSNMKQDVLNTLVQNPRAKFVNNIRLCALDSFSRFGLLEVGYAADWRNPAKESPLLSDHEDATDTKPRVIEDREIPVNERMYFKRINPKRVRVSVTDNNELENQEWVGYYQFYYTKFLKNTKGIKFPSTYDTSGYISPDYTGASGVVDSSKASQSPELLRLLSQGEVTKVWHIWDLISMDRLLVLDGSFDKIWSSGFDRLPLIDLRWDLRSDGWFPIPPAYQWLSPQDEINEAREQTRSFRRRFTRKFFALGPDFIEEEEVEKFVSGPDGVVIKFKKEGAIGAIENPEQGQTASNALIIAKDDFNIISGTSAEARGQSDRETATQAKLIDARSQIRESADQLDFSEWLCRIGRETLTQAQEKLTDGVWAKYTTDPSENIMEEMQVSGPTYKYIKSQDISDGYDFDIDMDITNATPQAMAAQEEAFTKFCSLVQGFPFIPMSPVLIREAAFRCGYRNEKVIAQMQQAAVAAMAAKAIQTGKLTDGQGNQLTPDQIKQKQMQQPSDGQVSTQLNQQLQ